MRASCHRVLGVMWAQGAPLAQCLGRTLLTMAGLAVAIALVSSIGALLTSSKATMTARAGDRVGVDRQAQAVSGADPAGVSRTVASHPGVEHVELTWYGATSGLEATTGGAPQAAPAVGDIVVAWPPRSRRAR
jgi:putative ABC transport system permease protein